MEIDELVVVGNYRELKPYPCSKAQMGDAGKSPAKVMVKEGDDEICQYNQFPIPASLGIKKVFPNLFNIPLHLLRGLGLPVNKIFKKPFTVASQANTDVRRLWDAMECNDAKMGTRDEKPQLRMTKSQEVSSRYMSPTIPSAATYVFPSNNEFPNFYRSISPNNWRSGLNMGIKDSPNGKNNGQNVGIERSRCSLSVE